MHDSESSAEIYLRSVSSRRVSGHSTLPVRRNHCECPKPGSDRFGRQPADQYFRIKVLSSSRNSATSMRLQLQFIVLVDADLQDPLEFVHQMVEQYRNGSDVVCEQRIACAGEGV